MTYEEFKQAYEVWQKKYNLPAFKILEDEFDLYLSDVEKIPKDVVLASIRRRMQEKIGGVVHLMEEITFPNNGSIVSLHEAKFLSDAQKETVGALMQKMMFFERKALILDLKPAISTDAEFINSFMKEWPEMLKQLVTVLESLRDGWKETDKKEILHYFG